MIGTSGNGRSRKSPKGHNEPKKTKSRADKLRRRDLSGTWREEREKSP